MPDSAVHRSIGTDGSGNPLGCAVCYLPWPCGHQGTVYNELRVERERAHALHGDTSMESYAVDDMNRLAILMEEVGEVSKEFNEARHDARPVDLAKLRKELIQTATMAAAWADRIENERAEGTRSDMAVKVTTIHRSDRPLWHPDDCDGQCCWRRVVHDPKVPCGSIQCATCYPSLDRCGWWT